MKVFVASIFTETNTFAPAPTGLAAFGGSCPRRWCSSAVAEPLATRALHMAP